MDCCIRTDETMRTKNTTANMGFAIAGVPCFADSLVVNESSVLRMKFCAKTPRHRKPPKRQIVKKSPFLALPFAQTSYL